jgi:heme-degrading monooxygenase HmoA
MAGYTYLWEFRVDEAQRPEFERHYGPEGTWTRLFRRAPGFIETLLLHDQSDKSRYVTVDRWQSIEEYRAFMERFCREYRELDQQCATLTASGESLGEYSQ